MNSFLLTLGITIALLLIAAFSAPFFIDWSTYRSYFEERATELLGRPVTFEGDLKVQLVPYPSLIVDDVRIGEPGSGEGVERIDMRAALTPLLSGELQVTTLTLVRPYAVLSLDATGRLSWAVDAEPTVPLDPNKIAIGQFEVVDGAFAIDDDGTGRTIQLDDVNLSGTAASLLGPFKVEGGGVVEGENYTFQISTGRLTEDGSGIRLKATILPVGRALTIDLDGALLRIEDVLAFDGRLVVERPANEDESDSWRLEGLLTASPENLVLDRLSIRLGSETQSVSLSGAATVRLGANPQFNALIETRQVDLDRTFGAGPEEPIGPQVAMARLAALLDPSIFPLPGHLAIDAQSVVLSGGLLEDLSIDLEIDGDVWSIERATVTAPGRTKIATVGSIGLGGETPIFDGAARLSTSQATVFANWVIGPQAKLPGFSLPAGSLDASGQVRLDSDGVLFDRISIQSGQTEIDGSVLYRVANTDRRGNISLALSADRLGVSSTGAAELGREIGGLGAFDSLLTDLDLDLQLQVGELDLARVEIQDVVLIGTIAEGDIRIQELEIGDIGGAHLSGSGDVRGYAKAPDGNFGLDVSARSLDGIIEALRALGATTIAEDLDKRAASLIPVKISVSLLAARTDDGSRGDLVLVGSAGDTKLDVKFGYDGRIDQIGEAVIDFTLDAANRDGQQLARQIGLEAPAGSAGDGRLLVTASGRLRDVLDVRLETAGIGIDGSAVGEAGWPVNGERHISSQISVSIADAKSLLAYAGISMPAGFATSFDLTGRLVGTDDSWLLSELEIDAGGADLSGQLEFDLSGAQRSVDGNLQADQIELSWLLASLYGQQPTQFPDANNGVIARGGSAWPSTALMPVVKPGWRGRIDLSSPSFALFGGLELSNAETALTFDDTRVSLDALRGDLFGGRLLGGLDINESDGRIEIVGRVDLSDARLEDIVWMDAGRAVATGSVSAGLEFDGRGRSLAAIVSSLSGTGSFKVVDGVLHRFNPNSFDQTVSAADAGLELLHDAVRQTFAGHLDSSGLEFDSVEGAFAISSGVLRASNIRVDSDMMTLSASATIQLPDFSLGSEWTLQTEAEDDGDRMRQVNVVFSGPIADPSRQIDVNPLLGYLSVRAYEREVERLEKLQAEIIEGQRLRRELNLRGEQKLRRERKSLELDAIKDGAELSIEDESGNSTADRGQQAQLPAGEAAAVQEATGEAAHKAAEDRALDAGDIEAQLLHKEGQRQALDDQLRLIAEDAIRPATDNEVQRLAQEAQRLAEEQAGQVADGSTQSLVDDVKAQLREVDDRSLQQVAVPPGDTLSDIPLVVDPTVAISPIVPQSDGLDSEAFRLQIEAVLHEIPSNPGEQVSAGDVEAGGLQVLPSDLGAGAPPLETTVIDLPRVFEPARSVPSAVLKARLKRPPEEIVPLEAPVRVYR